MMQVNRKHVLWILVFAAASLITVLFLGPAGISVGIGVSELLFVIASLLFYAVPIAIVVYVISLVKRYVDCKVMESKRAVEMDTKIELLGQQIERIEGKVDKIAENRGAQLSKD
jgi:membrane protein implicated in regulation of membrane protease activity